MADGHIKIAIEVDGKEVDVASKSLDNLEDAGIKGGKGAKAAEDGLKGVGEESTKASGNVKKFVASLGLVAIGAAAFKILKSSMDDAITRFDTLNQFPKVMQQIGFTAEESENAISKLSEGIEGLPTKLDDVTSTAQQLAVMTGDLDGAVDTTLALNNAFLASSASTSDAQRGLQQYVQMLAKGEVDLQSWRTLQETMGVALNDVAESFGYAGESAQNDLYDALKAGDITFNDFNAKLVELSNETGGFGDRAKTASTGIATSFQNLKTAVARGLVGIITSFNELSIAVTGNDIAENIDGMKHIIIAAFKVINGAVEMSIPVFKLLATVISALLSVAQSLAPVLIGMAAAFAIHAVINGATKALESFSKATILSTTVSKTSAATTKILAAAQKTYTGILTAANVVQGVLTGRITLSTAAMLAKAAASKLLGTALKVMSGPVGWVTLGVGALAGAVVGVVKWFNKATEEGERLTAETEELGNATDELTESIDGNAESYKKSQVEIEGSAKANEDLAKKISDLAGQENRSAAEKEMLIAYTDQLNESVEGLNLSYDEEADALNMSSEQMQARLDLFSEQETANEAMERLVEITKEQNEAEAMLAENNELQRESNQLHDDGVIKKGEHKEAIADLEEQEQALMETIKALGDEQELTEEQMVESMEAITAATESGVANQIILFDDLSESQQATIENMKATWGDYKDAATDMFDTLSDEAELTVSEMTANLEENQRVIGEWSEGIATLAERGVDEGLLNTLREAGPESAGHVKELVNASDAELDKLSESFSQGGKSATDALSKSLGIEETEIMNAVGHLVTDTEQSLKDQIKASNFEDIGGAIPEGVEEGMVGGTDAIGEAAKKMAEVADNMFKAEAGIQSPSTVFTESGKNLSEGVALGINDGYSVVEEAIQKLFSKIKDESSEMLESIDKDHKRHIVQISNSLSKLVSVTSKGMTDMLKKMKDGSKLQTTAMKKLATDITSPFKNTKSQFNSVGANAMTGLNQGLIGGRANVLATARGIANSITGTMKSALRIHSPSRVMEDDVGWEVSAGVALGMEKNSSVIDKAISGINNKIMRMGTPEMALGISGGGAMSAGHSIINNYSSGGGSQSPKTVTNNSKPTVYIEKIENHSDSDIPKILEESAWILSREDKRL